MFGVTRWGHNFPPTFVCPFPLGDLEIGKFIEQMNLDSSTVEDIFCNSTLEWLNLSKEQFL